jgi:cullin 1
VMLRFLSNMFYYLDRYFVPKQSLPSLREVGITSFRDQVYLAKRIIAKNVVIERINRERDGEEIDRALLKDILNIFVENGFGSVEFYKNDFEVAMLEDTITYYSRKVDFWISELSFTEYLVKAEECLKHERDRVTHYLHSSSEKKLLEIVQNELLFSHSTHLVENVRSSFHVLLRDDKIEDLSRMYRLFSQIPEGLQLATIFFEQYVSTEGLKLVERANNAVDSEARTSDIIDRLREDKFLDKVLELDDKYEFYVINVFGNNVIFQRLSRSLLSLYAIPELQE